MAKNKLQDLRDHLFATLEGLLDEENPMDLERAETVAKVAQVVVNSAKVEADFIKTVGGIGSDFIEGSRKDQRQLTAHNEVNNG